MDSQRWRSPELAFVVRASAPQAGPLNATAVADWRAVHSHALEHRVLPRLWRNAAQLIPEPHASALRTDAATQAQDNLRLLAHTIETATLLERAGIEVIVLKGPLLAQQLYGDYALRTCGDVDLLVRADDFGGAAQALAAAGFTHDARLDHSALNRHRRTRHDLAFGHPEDDTLIELHVDVAQPHYSYRVEMPEWWRQRRRIKVGGRELFVLSPEHAFIFALLHATKHHWHRLDLIGDFAAFALLPLDWAAVERIAQRSGMTRALATANGLAAHLYGGAAPAEQRLVQRLVHGMLDRTNEHRWENILLDLQLRERWRDRARYLYQRAIRPALHA